MNFQTIKQQVCRFLMSVMGFLFLTIVCGAAEGALFLPLALGLGLADLIGMNILCGLAAAKPASGQQRVPVRRVRRAPTRRPIPLRVVRGGRAA